MRSTGGSHTSVVGCVVTFVVVGACLMVSVVAALPATVVTSSWAQRTQVRVVLPQSWAFFTRDPQTPSLVLYRSGRGRAERADTLPQTSLANGLGLSRSQRSQDTEKAILASEVTDWVDCSALDAVDCLTRVGTHAAQEVSGVRRDPNFCGTYVLALRQTTPFNYRRASRLEAQPTRAAKIAVRCP